MKNERTVQIDELIAKTLTALSDYGLGHSRIEHLKSIGFKQIENHFNELGIIEYSEEVANSFVAVMRSEYEREKIPLSRFQNIRKCNELLKAMNQTGKLDLSRLPRWKDCYNPFRQNLTSEQLSNPDDLISLVWNTKNAMLKAGLTEKSIKDYGFCGFEPIMRYCYEYGVTDYDQSAIARFVESAWSAGKETTRGRRMHSYIRKAAAFLHEYHTIGKLECKMLSHWGKEFPNDNFTSVLNSYCENCMKSGRHGQSIKNEYHILRRFLLLFEAQGYKCFGQATLADIKQCILIFIKPLNEANAPLIMMRRFLKYLYEQQMTPSDLSIAIPHAASPKRPIREGYTPDELDKILSSVDKNTVMGKRDFAIIMIAVTTGLRGVDIVNLKRQDIDWRSKEISVTQSKTGVPLKAPLTAGTGNAIAEYLLNARPDCDLPYIFLSTNRPYRKLTRANSKMERYGLEPNINAAYPSKRGFHAFRRTFAGTLLKADTALPLLSEMLGHTDIDSAKPYLAVNEDGLKMCALSLVQQKGGVL